MSGKALQFGKGDMAAIGFVVMCAVIIALGFLLRFTNAPAPMAQIYQDGIIVQEISMRDNTVFRIGGNYTNTIEICDGTIAVIDSNCPGADCVHSGSIETAGSSIVCLPNRMEIRLTGEASVDAFVR